MTYFLKLKKTISSATENNDTEDVLSIKKSLNNLGYYKIPTWGMTNFGDIQMFDGICDFQKDKGLKVDGVMRPKGETETAINNALKQQSLTQNHKNHVIDRDKEIKNRMYPLIKEHEKDKDFPYKDSKGYITIGLGSNIDDQKKFSSLKWKDEDGNPFDEYDTQYFYQKLKNTPQRNYIANFFKDKTPLRLDKEERQRLYEEHISDDLQYLRRIFKNFDDFPTEMQDVLIDIKYNTGNVDRLKWPKLHQAISQRDLDEIINNVHRRDVDARRNQWAIQHLQKIKQLNY